jgi:hypothetical protein
MKKPPDSITQLKEGIRPIAIGDQFTTDSSAAWILSDLPKSGITAATAKEACLSYTSSRDRIGHLLNRRTHLPSGSCLLIPYFEVGGAQADYCRLKPENPRQQFRDGEPRAVKYHAPSGQPSRLYIAPGAVAGLSDATAPMIITEGEKKCLALNQHGYLSVAVAGVWNLLKKKSGVERGRTFQDYEWLWPHGIPLRDRKITLLLDSDARTNRNLSLALKYICQHLESHGGVVLVANLPDEAGSNKVGADDYLVAQGPAAMQRVIDQATPPSWERSSTKSPKASSAAELITAIGTGYELWHDTDDRAFASIGRRSYPIRSKAFRTLLVTRFRNTHVGKVPNSESLSAALLAIEGIAVHDRPECEANVRVAEHGGRIYFHLADSNDTVIEIGPDGWRECQNPPVRFVRVKGIRPLPLPQAGGRLEDLRRLINVPEESQFALIRAWIVQAFRKHGPFPLLVLLGEHGSAKTTTARVLKRLIDPRELDVRAEPKDVRDLMIAVRTNWIIAFDNLSYLPPWLSDALCRLATGGGFGTRELHTDDEETIFVAKRPAVLNGIEQIVTRPDLLERSVLIQHPPIDEDSRRPESRLWTEFDTLLPQLLGAIFDYLAGGLRMFPSVQLS